MALQPKSEPMRFNVTPKEKRRITNCADELEISIAELIRRAMEDFLVKRGK